MKQLYPSPQIFFRAGRGYLYGPYSWYWMFKEKIWLNCNKNSNCAAHSFGKTSEKTGRKSSDVFLFSFPDHFHQNDRKFAIALYLSKHARSRFLLGFEKRIWNHRQCCISGILCKHLFRNNPMETTSWPYSMYWKRELCSRSAVTIFGKSAGEKELFLGWKRNCWVVLF